MKKNYNVTAYLLSSDGKSNTPSTIVITANNEQDVVDFILQKTKDIMKTDNWKSLFANDGFTPIIDYEEIDVINL